MELPMFLEPVLGLVGGRAEVAWELAFSAMCRSNVLLHLFLVQERERAEVAADSGRVRVDPDVLLQVEPVTEGLVANLAIVFSGGHVVQPDVLVE